MSDGRLRELERRWREAGTVEAEAAWLRERARSGAVDPQRVALAASLGHEAAVIAMPAPPLGDETTRAALSSLAGRDSVVLVRFGVALLQDEQPAGSLLRRLADGVLAAIAHAGRVRLGGAGQAAVRAAEQWAVCPCPDCARASAVAGEAALAEAADLAQSMEDWRAPDSVAEGNHRHVSRRLSEACGRVASVPGGGGHAQAIDALAASWPQAWEPARRRVEPEVVPWLLGYGDPVRDRVDARQRRGDGGPRATS